MKDIQKIANEIITSTSISNTHLLEDIKDLTFKIDNLKKAIEKDDDNKITDLLENMEELISEMVKDNKYII